MAIGRINYGEPIIGGETRGERWLRERAAAVKRDQEGGNIRNAEVFEGRAIINDLPPAGWKPPTVAGKRRT